MPDNPLVQEILGLVDEVFSDTTVPKSQTLAWMEEIGAAVQANIDALKDDLAQEGEEAEG